jgi:starch synthase
MSRSALSVVHLASEMAPLVKVGGLGDVVGSLAAEQSRRGHRVTVCVPAYRTLAFPEGWTREVLAGAEVPWGMGRERARFELLHAPFLTDAPGSLRVLLVGHAGERRFFERPGIYTEPATGAGYPDNAERFLFFARAALEGLKALGEPVDILHAHDQQAAWVPCFVRTHEKRARIFRHTATVFTIHNLGYQGIHDPWVLGLAGFPGPFFHVASPFEFWGRVNYMKVGLAFADLLSTVSPRYAEEIQQDGEYGFGLEGVLQRRGADLRGILNGIDDAVWDPRTDPLIVARYEPAKLARKERNRATLSKRLGLAPRDDVPLFGLVSRFSHQKGIDLVLEIADALVAMPAQLVLAGTGDTELEARVLDCAARHPGQVGAFVGFDEGLAHLLEASADCFLMPSRFEPCGMNQMYSQRYGTPPIVHGTGGLADSVTDVDDATLANGTGWVFRPASSAALLEKVRKAAQLWHNRRAWRRVQRNGMARDFSWRASAREYARLYAQLARRA